MNFFSNSKSSLITCLLGGVGAFLLGCVITVGESTDAGGVKECGDPLTHSHKSGDQCYCDVGYDWCTSDPNDYECCDIPGKDMGSCNQAHNVVQGGKCFCEEGYTWCTNDPDDYSCCESMQGGSTGTTTEGTTDGTTEGTTDASTTASETTTSGTTGVDCEYLPVPDSCDPNTELAFCTNTTMDCIGGSKQYHCDNGVWVEDPQADLDQICMIDGHDFAYGCTLEDKSVITECGMGPGTPCANEPDFCPDLDTHSFCLHGKLSTESCQEQCTVIGDDMGVTYDYGECGDQRGMSQCLCCDFDEPGCGGGGTTGTDTDTDTGTTG